MYSLYSYSFKYDIKCEIIYIQKITKHQRVNSNRDNNKKEMIEELYCEQYINNNESTIQSMYIEKINH